MLITRTSENVRPAHSAPRIFGLARKTSQLSRSSAQDLKSSCSSRDKSRSSVPNRVVGVFYRLPFCWGFRLLRAPPEIESRYRRVGMPVHSQPFESFSRRKLPQPVGPLRSLSQPEIVHRQNIRPSQLEDQEHLSSPTTNSSHRVELPHSLLIRQPLQPFQIQPPIHEPLSQIPNVRDLLRRQPGLPEPINIR